MNVVINFSSQNILTHYVDYNYDHKRLLLMWTRLGINSKTHNKE